MDKPIKSSGIVNPENRKKPSTVGILGINLVIFLIYFMIGLSFGKLDPSSSLAGLVLYGYLIHASALLILAIARAITRLITGNRNGVSAGDFMISLFAILIIGFGACTFAFTQGFIK